MNKKFGIVGLATGVLLAGAISASAATVIDFTDDDTTLTGTVLGSIGWTATGVPVPPNNNQTFDGGTPVPADSFGSLAFEQDGWGIDDDEISIGQPPESITIDFDSAVRITGFAFLDLFEEGSTGFGEFGRMSVDGGTPIDLLFDSDNAGSGYAEYLGAPITGTSVTFTVGSTNDDAGVADGALAALQVAPVPLPAAGLLLLGGLGGLAALRRRRKAA